MPRLNGIELTRRIRQELPQTTIILMSSYPEDAYRLMASDSGADAFVNKQVLNSAADVMTFNRMQVWGSEAGGHGRAPPSSASLLLTDPVPRRGSSSWRLAFACPGRQLRATAPRVSASSLYRCCGKALIGYGTRIDRDPRDEPDDMGYREGRCARSPA
jgi:CheY-like chemotaxis protein